MHTYLDQANKIILSGGLSQSNSICQRLANLCNKEVHRPDEKEATARGLCFLLDTNRANWNKSKTTIFRPETDNCLQQRYSHWQILMEKLTP